NYTGLFETIRRFKPPTAAEVDAVPADFMEVAKLPGLVDAMVAIDEQWDILKAVRKAGYQAPKNHPDAQPAGTAVILTEHFRESQRLDDSVQRGPEFLAKLQFAEKVTREAEAALREFATAPTAENKAGLDRRFDALAQTCSGCHKFYRDRKP
ncbi:MAG TPA: cytochrome c, partial [Verrucomicrobiae bacterium]|nr:cytochrome c [Verrucomicrobiae bacterium]